MQLRRSAGATARREIETREKETCDMECDSVSCAPFVVAKTYRSTGFPWHIISTSRILLHCGSAAAARTRLRLRIVAARAIARNCCPSSADLPRGRSATRSSEERERPRMPHPGAFCF
ncbi:MAG TPA: hypothetical protein VHF86_06250, partial [Xanthomonadaceae bacterium]|nr:hypothetical protein [Xanthomonadaceae bacterium]